MQLSITFRHMDASDFLKEYAREKVERVNKYLDRAGEAHVVLSLERHLQNADIQIQSGSWVLRGREKSEDMYASIDLAMDKIERQLKRYKDKLKNHHDKRYVHHQQGALSELRVRHDVFSFDELLEGAQEAEATEGSPPSESGPKVIRTNEFLARSLSVEEAIMQMDLLNSGFLVFTHKTSGEMNVVYRRKDGQYGLIEASAAPQAQSA
jgi:putative sigma-54 modulation protein